MEAILFLIFGVAFLAFGIRHDKNIHEEEGIESAGSIILDHITGWIEKLPYWFTKTIYLLIGLGCLIWSYLMYF